MSKSIRYFVMIRFQDQDALINSIEKLEKSWTAADYASPGMSRNPGESFGLKFLSYEKAGDEKNFEKFSTRMFKTNLSIRNAELIPGYLSDTQVISGYDSPGINRISYRGNLYVSLQLYHGKNSFQFHLLTDDDFRKKSAITFFNDSRRLLLSRIKKG